MERQKFISDEEIDKILGRIGEFKATGTFEKKDTPQAYNRIKKNVISQTTNNNKTPFTFSYLLDENTKNSLYDKKLSTTTLENASFIRIFYAFLTDICIVTILTLSFIYAASFAFGLDSFVSNTYSYLNSISFFSIPGIFIAVFALELLISFVYFIYFESLIGQTFGKMFMNIKITDTDGQRASIARLFFRTLFFYIPIFGLFGLHNKLASTKLVKK